MDLSFMSIMDFIATYFFDGSTTLAGLAILVVAWIISAVVLMNMKSPPTYSVVPMIPMGRLIRPEDIAETILFLASELAGMITGQVMKVSGGKAI